MADRNDVARKAGVSGATVSRVFNRPGTVAAKTREKVLRAAKELNYHPNAIARNFVKGRSGNIGVVVPYIQGVHIFSSYYFSEILSGIGEALKENGYNLLLFLHNAGHEEEDAYLKYFVGGKVDGCILLGTYRNDGNLLKLKDSGCKFCLVNNYIPGSGISFIDADNLKGSYEATTHLINLGHRRIAFLNGPLRYANSVDRLAGYSRAMKDNCLPVEKDCLLEGNYGRKSGYAAASRLFKLHKLPDAVFAANDRMAAGLVQGLKEKGVRVPEDIAVVGFDDSDIATVLEPKLTTVRVLFFEMGKRCGAEFVKIVNGESRQGFEIFIEPKLIVRSSCGARLE